MAKKRGRGRPKGSSQGPRLKRGKLSNSRAMAYMNRGLSSALKKRGAGRKVGKGKKGRGAPGKPKSAAHRAAISKALKAYHRGKKRKGRKAA